MEARVGLAPKPCSFYHRIISFPAPFTAFAPSLPASKDNQTAAGASTVLGMEQSQMQGPCSDPKSVKNEGQMSGPPGGGRVAIHLGTLTAEDGGHYYLCTWQGSKQRPTPMALRGLSFLEAGPVWLAVWPGLSYSLLCAALNLSQAGGVRSQGLRPGQVSLWVYQGQENQKAPIFPKFLGLVCLPQLLNISSFEACSTGGIGGGREALPLEDTGVDIWPLDLAAIL